MLPQPFLKAFPEPETVFAEPVERYARHLHPLISINLSALIPGNSDWIHLISPIEPCDGYVGDYDAKYWGPYLQANWIAFRLNSQSRYELLGDFRFFGIENDRVSQSMTEELTEFYEEQHASYAEHKAAYEQTGQICRLMFNNNAPKPVAALTHLGGRAPVGNMVYTDVPGAAFTYTDGDGGAPRTADGRQYQFIAAVPGWHYRNAGADTVLLYYDPVERVALQTFVFT